MPSQEQEHEQQGAQEQAEHHEGPRHKKKKMKWSPVSRHRVVAGLVARSRAARASTAATRTSPAATRTSPAAIRTPTFVENDYGRYEQEVQSDEQVVESDEQEVESDEQEFEGDEEDVEDDEFVTVSTSIRALTSKFRSEAWKEYVPLIVNGQVSKGRCKHCQKKISAKRGAGTSALLKHLDRCKKRDSALRIVQGLNSTLRSPDGRRLKNWNFDPLIARKELARMIALHGLPFVLVEYDGFRRFVASLNPLFKPITRKTSRNDCMKAFKDQKVELQEIFKDAKCRFSLTADMWTSNQTLGYMCITCHYITEDWKVQKKVIKFLVVESPHSGIAMPRVLRHLSVRRIGIEELLLTHAWAQSLI